MSTLAGKPHRLQHVGGASERPRPSTCQQAAPLPLAPSPPSATAAAATALPPPVMRHRRPPSPHQPTFRPAPSRRREVRAAAIRRMSTNSKQLENLDVTSRHDAPTRSSSDHATPPRTTVRGTAPAAPPAAAHATRPTAAHAAQTHVAATTHRTRVCDLRHARALRALAGHARSLAAHSCLPASAVVNRPAETTSKTNNRRATHPCS